MKQPKLILALVLVMGILVGAFFFPAQRVSAAASSELPPGLVKGRKFNILISSGGGIATETLEVIDTSGSWVHANVVQSNIWGQGDVWVNLASTDFGYVNVMAAEPPK
jgi:hypothetical protein